MALPPSDVDGFYAHGDTASESAANDVDVDVSSSDVQPAPHDIFAEGATISASLLSSDHAARAAAILKPKDFFSEAHRRIFEAVTELVGSGKPIDVVLVASWLLERDRLKQVGGMAYLTEVLNSAPAVVNVEAYAYTVARHARTRKAIEAAEKLAADLRARKDPSMCMEVALPDLQPESKSGPTVTWAGDLAAPLPTKNWTSRDLTIIAGRPSVLAGRGGTRKGWLAMALQICGAADVTLFGRVRMRTGLRSLYADYEQTPTPTAERYQLLAHGYEIDLAGLENRLGYVWKPIPTWAPRSERSREKARDALSRMVEGIDLVVVDSVRASAQGVEENSNAASMPLELATEVSTLTGTTFLFLDHAGKPPADNAVRGRKDAQRGHSSKLDASQTLFVFSCEKGEPTLVTCERSQLAPEPSWPADFQFTLASHNGGVRLEEVVTAPVQRNASAFDALKTKIVELVKGEPTLTSKNAICARITGGNKTDKLQAIDELMEAGRLVQLDGGFRVHRA
ncbi:MAG TPA: DnaB-like helicase N-terminal domain-containing protein [Polyangiaceae bacterium]|jgi:hypothetical protein|nr:DnaB-like helicase N-terminal domain-containing protein [Polyangiaceae bacterium]